MLLCLVWHNMFIFCSFSAFFITFSYAFLLIFHENWLQTHFLASVFSTPILTPALIDRNFLTLGLTNLALGYKFSWSDLCVNFHILFSFLFDSSYICTTTSCSYTTYDIGCFTWFYHGRVVVDHGYTVGTRIDPTYHG